MARPKGSSTAAEAYLAFVRDEESDGAIAGRLGVSRQRIQTLHRLYRAKTGQQKPEISEAAKIDGATDSTGDVAPQWRGNQFAGPDPRAPQAATADNAPVVVLALRELAGDEERVGIMLDKVLRGSAPRAAAIAVGIEGHAFSKRMETDSRFRELVLRAAHEAESSVAQNLYRLATGNSPQSAQAAIAWLEKRHPEIWGREPQRIEVEVSGSVDVAHILSDPRLIELENEAEARRQQIESGQIIEGDFRELPAHDEPRVEGSLRSSAAEAPPFPQDDLMSARPLTIEPQRRTNRPGQGDPDNRGHVHEIMVDGIKTLVVDERAPDDERPLAI